MKTTFIKNHFIKKHTIYLIICICICILLIIMSWFILYSKNRESFEDAKPVKPVKDTDYLEPVKKFLSDDEWNILYNKINKTYPEFNITLEKLKEYANFVTKDEVNFYLTNNKFPWSKHVTSRFTELMTSATGDSESKKKIDPVEMVNSMMKMFPNRYAYKQYITSVDMKEDLTLDPYLIYSGEKPAPTDKAA